MFASVYHLECEDGDWAVRCFLYNRPELAERYALLHQQLSQLRFPFTVGFQYQEKGIRYQGNWYPILKMPWCQGETLNRWIERNLKDPDSIKQLAEEFKSATLELSRLNIAHGDLQHGNVLIKDGQIRLVDYDGMYTPAVAHLRNHEIGHSNYQHPQRAEHHFGPWLDNFPSWLIYLSMKCIALDPVLWASLRGGEEQLLFNRDDLKNPCQSATFDLLERHHISEIRRSARLLRYLLLLPVEQVPDLSSCPDVPDDLPEVRVPEPEVLPDWVRNHDEKANLNQCDEYSDVAWFPSGNADHTLRSTSARKYPCVFNHLKMGRSWSKWSICAAAVVLILAGYIVSLQAGFNPIQGSAADSQSNEDPPPPEIEFPPLAFDKNGMANLITRGDTFYAQADAYQAEAWYNEAINRLNDELSGEDNFGSGSGGGRSARFLNLHKNLAIAQKKLADCYYCTERAGDAAEAYGASGEEWKLVTGKSDARQVAISLTCKATTEYGEGDVDKALLDFERATAIFNKYPKVWDDARRQNIADYASALRFRGDEAGAGRLEKTVPSSHQ